MKLSDLGWLKYRTIYGLTDESDNLIGRIAVENKSNFLVYTNSGEFSGVLRRKLIHKKESSSELPKVGDWVRVTKNDDKVAIEEVFPRFSTISRKTAMGREEQVIATNVDLIFIVQGLDDNFNLARLERYLHVAYNANVDPVIILNKSDLSKDPEAAIKEVKKIAPTVPILTVSALEDKDLESLSAFIKPALTVVFVGSSGVGKSTLINKLVGSDLIKTQEVRLIDSRGKHTTTKREMILLPSGGVLIDTPGMRELHAWAVEEKSFGSFADLEEISLQCKFRNCDHIKSDGCAILEAQEKGIITLERYNSFLKMKRENAYNAGKFDKKELIKRKNVEKRQHRTLKKIIRSKYK